MAGLVPAIHESQVKTWMPGTSPGMTRYLTDGEKPALNLLVAAVAERLVVGGLAAAKPNLLGLLRFEDERPEAHRFVRAVAEGLLRAASASAPGIVLAGFDIDAVRRFLGGNGIAHLRTCLVSVACHQSSRRGGGRAAKIASSPILG